MRPSRPDDARSRIEADPVFDATWYLRRYPDVARLPLDPATHYARIGAVLRRDPGPNFCARHYLRSNPDVAAAGLDPLSHYIAAGRKEGRAPHPGTLPARAPSVLRRVQHLRALLETGGLVRGPRDALSAIAEGGDSPEATAAAIEALAFAALQTDDFDTARQWLTARLDLASDAAARLLPLLAITTARAGDPGAAQRILDRAADSVATALARGWTEDSADARLACLNSALRLSGLAPVTLNEGGGALIDRLCAAAPVTPATDTSPLISVLMAAHNSANTIATALRALQAQSWGAFELIVIDDASDDDTARIVSGAAAKDPRIRLLRLERNRGAYVARNAGLAQARGRFVTLHDADDWSHPERLARQVRFILDNPGYAGCIGQQSRVTPDLRVSRWTGTGGLVFENMTSLMLPTELLRDCLGGWDELRASADSELLRRVRRLFGARAVAPLETGPVTLVRDTIGSATADGATGMGWFYYGARREYHEAQTYHHARAEHLFYPPGGPRAFAAPGILQNAPTARDEIAVDHVYAGILTTHDRALDTLLGWLDEDREAGRRAALVPLYALSMPEEGGLSIHPALRSRVDGAWLRVLCYGERARCLRFRRLPGQDIPEMPRYLPRVHEGARQVLPLTPD